jgi:hypothetical protein
MRIERAIVTEDGCIELATFNLYFAEHFAFMPLHPSKAMASTIETVRDGCVLVARNDGGEIIGTIGLFETSTWYSEEPYLTNRWLNVMPGEAGAFRALLEAARAEAESRTVMLQITRSNHKTELRGPLGRVAEAVGFVPFGHATVVWQPPLGGEEGDGG